MLAAIIQNNQNVTPAAAPAASPGSGGPLWADRLGDPKWADRTEDSSDFVAEMRKLGYNPVEGVDAPANARLLYSTPTRAVYVTFLNVEIVERGNLLIFIAKFDRDQKEINFVYMKPGSNRPIADPGFGLPGSQIRQLTEEYYAIAVDTTGFQGGTEANPEFIRWHFWSGSMPKSSFGEYPIPIKARPAGLL